MEESIRQTRKLILINQNQVKMCWVFHQTDSASHSPSSKYNFNRPNLHLSQTCSSSTTDKRSKVDLLKKLMNHWILIKSDKRDPRVSRNWDQLSVLISDRGRKLMLLDHLSQRLKEPEELADLSLATLSDQPRAPSRNSSAEALAARCRLWTTSRTSTQTWW